MRSSPSRFHPEVTRPATADKVTPWGTSNSFFNIHKILTLVNHRTGADRLCDRHLFFCLTTFSFQVVAMATQSVSNDLLFQPTRTLAVSNWPRAWTTYRSQPVKALLDSSSVPTLRALFPPFLLPSRAVYTDWFIVFCETADRSTAATLLTNSV